jgi:asparagine synthase (glutamine-hydrolysing)
LANSLPLAFKFNHQGGKYILKKLAEKYLPAHLVNRSKHGFSAPVNLWLRGPLRYQAATLFTRAEINRLGLLNYSTVNDLWQDFLSGNHYRARQIWTLFVWQLWAKKYL